MSIEDQLIVERVQRILMGCTISREGAVAMAELILQCVRPESVSIHHIDGDPHNNDVSNLLRVRGGENYHAKRLK